jgi:hypothetical protein
MKYILMVVITLAILAGMGAAEDTTVPLGHSGTVDDWQISVSHYYPDATRSIAAANMFNPEPSAGGQFAMVFVSAKNVGKDKQSFNSGNLHLEGSNGAVYSPPFVLICPRNFPSGDAFPGSILSGNIGFDVNSNDIGSLKLYYSGMWSNDKTYFDLPNGEAI